MGRKPRTIYGQWIVLFMAMSLWIMPGMSTAQDICGGVQTNLIAGRGIAAGTVDISHDHETLQITIATEGWAIIRSQVHIAKTREDIPQTRFLHIPRVGRFDYTHKHTEPVFTDDYTINLEELGLNAGGPDCIDDTIAICVHALVVPTHWSTRWKFPRSAWAEGLSFSKWGRSMYVEYDVTCCEEDLPVIDVFPLSHDFGAPYIGCEAEKPYTISNEGTGDLVINGFDFASPSVEFSFDADEGANGPLPWTLHPQEEVDVYIRFLPEDEFANSAYLTILSNDPVHPECTVEASGVGSMYGINVDEFEVTQKGVVDILFTLDRSGSMSDDNALVVANFGTFINELVSLNVDYHVAVAVEDDGCVLGSDAYIDNTFSPSDAESTFETMADIYLTLGTYGANTERGFSLAEAALKSANIGSGGCNEGMYREGATLSIVHVSDEPEQSVNPYTYYVSLFQGMKSDPDDVIINAVAGDYPDGCGSAGPGTGYYEATVATGGLFLSICADDWGSHLTQLAQGSVIQHDSFELTQLPVPETIRVRVDGITTTTGWQYDPAINSIVFDRDHIPSSGSWLEVEYHLMPDCES